MAKSYLALLRGINVGGKNKVSMVELKACLEELGCTNVRTYIASGNVLFEADRSAAQMVGLIEDVLPRAFELDSELVKVLILTREQLQKVIDQAPPGFGTQPATYHSDAVFLMDLAPGEAFKVFKPRAGVDAVWPGPEVIYSQRLSAQRTRSGLSAIMASPLYKSMTIRSWNTTVKLLELMKAAQPD